MSNQRLLENLLAVQFSSKYFFTFLISESLTPTSFAMLGQLSTDSRTQHNGIRHVLPNIVSYFWSASVDSSMRDGAFDFYGGTGHFMVDTREVDTGVRCVGLP